MNARNKLQEELSFGAFSAMSEVLGYGMFGRLRDLGTRSTLVAKASHTITAMKELEKAGCVYLIGKADGGFVYAATREGAELAGVSEEKIKALDLPSFAAWYP